jgi:hypothetical protein
MQNAATGLDEASTRAVLLVQAFDCSPPDNPLWTPEDRQWATRLAQQSPAAKAAAPQFLGERAQHALKRLLPRDPAAARALARRLWRPAWLLAAAAVGLVLGLLADTIGASQRINLLAPPVWAVLMWNLLVYTGLVLALLLPQRWPQRVRAALSRRLSGPGSGPGNAVLAAFQSHWARVSATLMSSRAACLLHIAAAALALGLVGSLYVRGLVLDYRAGWQSTFLDVDQVRSTLAVLLSPAALLTGISVPDVAALQALRSGPEAAAVAAPSASAAPWIHLYAAMLLLLVVLPRSVLAAWAALRAWHLAKRLPLPLHEPYFARLARAQHGGAAQVRVQPHGAAPSAAAVAGLRRVLVAALGEPLGLQVAAATTYGEEDAASSTNASSKTSFNASINGNGNGNGNGNTNDKASLSPNKHDDATTLCLLLVDLAATPEADTHGRFIQNQRLAAPAVQMLLCADETALRARFATLPARLTERRSAWRGFAAAQGIGFVSVDLLQPDLPAAEAALQAALHV